MTQDINDDRITPLSYVTGAYMDYQRKYADNPRESDKKLLALIEETAPDTLARAGSRILDIGCSNGNFLRYLHRRHPSLSCCGADLFSEIIEDNIRNPELQGINFFVGDVRKLESINGLDVVVANAVLSRFSDAEFEASIASLSRTLKPGGHLFCFEWVHPYEQMLAIREFSLEQPQGLTLHLRPYSNYSSVLKGNGFADIRFDPFEIPVDLPVPASNADLATHTVRTETGKRLNFRGALYQPWCHVVARKRADA